MLTPTLLGITIITSINDGKSYPRYVIRFHNGIFLANKFLEKGIAKFIVKTFPNTDNTVSYPITQAFDRHFDKPENVAHGKINSMTHVTE